MIHRSGKKASKMILNIPLIHVDTIYLMLEEKKKMGKMNNSFSWRRNYNHASSILNTSGRDDLDGRWKEVDLKTRQLN